MTDDATETQKDGNRTALELTEKHILNGGTLLALASDLRDEGYEELAEKADDQWVKGGTLRAFRQDLKEVDE